MAKKWRVVGQHAPPRLHQRVIAFGTTTDEVWGARPEPPAQFIVTYSRSGVFVLEGTCYYSVEVEATHWRPVDKDPA